VTIDGRTGHAIFMKGNFEPCDDAEATMAEIMFDDGDRMFLRFTDGPDDKTATEIKSYNKFDPGEPRDPHGRWTEVGGGTDEKPEGFEFISPNVEHTNLSSAQSQITGQRQRALRQASREVDRQLGLDSSDYDIIGAWKDGAENSMMSITSNAQWDQLRASAAMKGHLADQKSVLIFKDHPQSGAVLYKFEAQGDVKTIHHNLLEDGVAFHTLIPHTDIDGKQIGATVYVADLDGKIHDAVDKASARYHSNVEYRFGIAEFIGTTSEEGTDREQRDDARRAYEQIVKESPVQGSQAVWGRVHNRWGETLNPDNDSFVREKNGEANGKLVDALDEEKYESPPFTDMTGHEREGAIGYLTPDGHLLDNGDRSHYGAAETAGTSMEDVLQEGGARVYIQPHDYVGLEIYKRPSQQQYNVLRKAFAGGQMTRFHLEDHAWETFTAPEGKFVTPRDALNTINKIFPVMPGERTDKELDYWSAYFRHSNTLEYWLAYFEKYNPYHEPGGSPEGGEFATGPGAMGGERIMQEIPARKPRSVKVEVVAKELNNRAGDILEKKFGVREITEKTHTPEQDDFIASAIAHDLKSDLKNGHSSPTWYSDKQKEAMGVATEMHPELATDPNKRFAYTVALAITSQGELVSSSARLTELAYDHYNKTGEFPTDLATKDPNITGNFEKMNLILKKFGPEGTKTLFDREYTVRDLENATGYTVGKTFKDDIVNGSAVLGPKIGMGFYQNLNGNFKPVTMDMWFMRAWGRMTGSMIGQPDMGPITERLRNELKAEGKRAPTDPDALQTIAENIVHQHEKDYKEFKDKHPKGKYKKSQIVHAAERYDQSYGGMMIEEPQNATKRAWMTDVFHKAIDKLKADGINLEPAAAQATWWNPEQVLWKHMGSRVRETDNDYAKALREIKEHGLEEEES
jgi:hypothetical protein